MILISLAMALMMRALACSQGQERTHSSLKYFEASVMIVVGCIDIAFCQIMEEIHRGGMYG